jgi:hypothetical protein
MIFKLLLSLLSLSVFACEGCAEEILIDNQNKSSGSLPKLDSVYAWNMVFQNKVSTASVSHVETIGDKLYYQTEAGDIWLITDTPKKILSGSGRGHDLLNIENELWSVEIDPLRVNHFVSGSLKESWSESNSILCPSEEYEYSCLGFYLSYYKKEIYISTNHCTEDGKCINRWSKLVGGKWINLKIPQILKENSYIAEGIEFKDKLVVGTWHNGLFAFDGKNWERIVLPTTNEYPDFPRLDTLSNFRTRPVIHEGEIYVVDFSGRTLRSSDLVNWEFELREEQIIHNSDIGHTILHDSVPNSHNLGFGFLSYKNELYICNKSSRRNFNDSIWQFIAPREHSKYFFKDRGEGTYSWKSPPGLCFDMAGKGNKLYAAVNSTNEELSGLYELDLSIMQDSTWEKGQRRNNP